jgi:hypothetical protein
LHQLIFKTGQALRAFIQGCTTISGSDDKFTGGLDAFHERRGNTAAAQRQNEAKQKESDQQIT